MNLLRGVWMLAVATVMAVSNAGGETAYFLMGGPFRSTGEMGESYVVAVSDAALIQQARDFLQRGASGPYLVPMARVAKGEDGINRNYAQPGFPPWPWHATEVFRWLEYDPNGVYPAVFLPEQHSRPSNVTDLLSASPPTSGISLVYFPLTMELSLSSGSAVSNLSTRGWVGAGERVLIAGFIVTGGRPRNVMLRALGPSLAKFGVAEPLADPAITLFRGSEMIEQNDSWTQTVFGGVWIPEWWDTPLRDVWPFVPKDTREPVLLLSLPPGAYTVHVRGAGDSTGIALIELFDRDAMLRP